MNINELKTLGQTEREMNTNLDAYFCRHGTITGTYSRAYGYDPKDTCARCGIENETLERLDRIEKLLIKMTTQTAVVVCHGGNP